jgi:hypothetical protein
MPRYFVGAYNYHVFMMENRGEIEITPDEELSPEEYDNRLRFEREFVKQHGDNSKREPLVHLGKSRGTRHSIISRLYNSIKRKTPTIEVNIGNVHDRIQPVGGKRTRKIRRKRTRKNRRNKRKHTRHFRK